MEQDFTQHTSTKISGILLAAGRSQRMGQPKLLLPWGSVPLVRHVAEIALRSKLGELIVVTGHRAEHVQAALDGLVLTIVHNAAFLDGQSTSVRAGVDAVVAETEAIVILLADQPLLQPSTIDAVIDVYRVERPLVVAPRYNGQRGNPVLFDRSLFPSLHALTGDQGARSVLLEHIDQIRFVDVADEGVVIDVDTPVAYQHAWERMQRANPSGPA